MFPLIIFLAAPILHSSLVKDERDVQKILTDMTEGLSNDSALAYMKNGGEEIDEEDAELLRASLENVIRQSKLIAKAKFTPKKYRKDKD